VTEAGIHATEPGRSLSGPGRVVAYLKEQILNGTLVPGTRIAEEDVSETIGLSRTPVREALKTLESEGLVRIERFRGAIVTELDARDVREVIDLRICLERYAITEALTDGRDLDLSELRAASEPHDGDSGPWGMLPNDKAFHFAIVRLHHNRRLERVLENTWDQVVRCSLQIIRQEPAQVESMKEHGELLAALEARDLEAATNASEEHLRNALRRVLLSD
jgi:DNA-binding GntR family transcriptional regulator